MAPASPLLRALVDISNAGGVAGAGRAQELCTAATCAAARAEGALPGAQDSADCRLREAAGGGGVGGASDPAGEPARGEQGVKPGRRQSACQTRACAVCTASVLWVSAAAAAATGGSDRPGSGGCSPWPPRRRSGRMRAQARRRRAGGVGEARPATRRGGSPDAGRGGGEQAAQESTLSPRAGGGAGASRGDGAPGRTCTRRAAGPAPPRSCSRLRPAPVGAPDTRREAFPPPGEVAARGGQRRARGRGRWCGGGEDRATGPGVLPDPASSLLSVSKRLPRLESEPKIRWCAPAWIPYGGWAHRGACWGRGARWQLSPPETKGLRRDARERGQPGISGSGRLTPPREGRAGRQSEWKLGSPGLGVRTADPPEFEVEDFPKERKP